MEMSAPLEGAVGLRRAAALFLLGCATVHFAVVPEHLRSYPAYGVLLLLVGLAQVALVAGLVLRPSPAVLLGGAAGMLAVIGVWLTSRTIGLPFGPVPWSPERIGLPDVLTTQMEWVAVILMLLADLRLDRPRARRHLFGAGPGLALAALVSMALTLLALAGVGLTAGH